MLPTHDLADLDGLTVGVYLEQWLSHVKGRVRIKTYEGYEALIRLHAAPALGHFPLSKLHPLHIQQLHAEVLEGTPAKPARSASTVANLHRVLVQALGQAVRWQLIATNPAKAAQPPRPRRAEMAAIDAEEAQRILQAARGTRFELPVALAISTGMRRGEILGLRWTDLDEEFTTAHVRPTLQITVQGLVFGHPKTGSKAA